MKIFNLGNSASDDFHRKLRRKVDTYQPELPESMWDVISHRLDERAAARKRLLFYKTVIVASFLLLSGITWLIGSRYESITRNKSNPPQNAPTASQVPIAHSPIIENGIISETSAPDLITDLGSSVKQSAISIKPKHKANGATSASIKKPFSLNKKEAESIPAIEAEFPDDYTEALTGGGQIIESLHQPLPEIAEVQLPESENLPAITIKTFKPFISVGLMAEYGNAFNTYSEGMAGNIMQNLESPGKSSAYGFQLVYAPSAKWRIISGLNIREQYHALSYDYTTVYRKPPDTVPGILVIDIPLDSAITGHAYQSRQVYKSTEIPLMAGFVFGQGAHSNFLLSIGTSLEWLNFAEAQRISENGLLMLDNTPATGSLNINLMGSVAYEYLLGRRIGLNVGIIFRRSATGLKPEGGGEKFYPHAIAARGGVSFKLH